MLHPYADKNTPFVLSPASLDWYLNKGWYRMGASIFTTHFLYFGGQPYSAVWIRQNLENFGFSKSQRKLMRRNAKLFDVSWGPRRVDEERNELYARYAADFDGRLSPTISDSLEVYDGRTNPFNTWETTIRDRVSGQLVGFSYFDLGEETVASILGVYDPKLKSFSLGYYTMLLELQYCMEQQLRYYYPGYVVPGYQRFDYKLRMGPSDYYDLASGKWLPYEQEKIEQNAPVEIQERKLGALAGELGDDNRNPRVLVYPFFEACLYDIFSDDYLPYPFFYPLGRDGEDHVVVVVFDPKDQEYLLLRCVHQRDSAVLTLTAPPSGANAERTFTDLLTVDTVLYRTQITSIMAYACRQLIAPGQ